MSRLIIKNLPPKTSEDKLRQSFSSFGIITDIQLKYTKDGKFRNFAFVGYKSEEEAHLAQKHFDQSYLGACKIQVEVCADLGDVEKKPRAWSKYSKDSSAYKNAHSVEDEKADPKKDAKKESERKRKEKQKLKHQKQKAVDDLMTKYKDDPKFQEFLRVHQRNSTESWNNDAILKVGRDYQDEANEGEDNDSERDQEEGKLALDNKLSDLEYLKSKGFTDGNHQGDKKVFFTIKLEGLPFNAKKKDVKKFIGSNMGVKSIRVPRHIKGIAYVGFASEKERQVVMKKDKSFMGTKQILVRQYDVDQKQAEMKSKVGKWKLQEDGLKDLDETIGQSGRLFIRNLSYAVTEDDLEGLFKPFGPLAEINVPIDKNTKQVKGFAFVTYVIPENAVQAYTKLDGSTFQGRLLHIIPGKPPKGEEELDNDNSPGSNNNYKQKKADKAKKEAGSSHNWNSLFLGASAVADIMSDKFNVSKEDVLLASGGTSAAVRLALGETQIVEETRQFLEGQGVKLDAFDKAKSTKRSKTTILVKNLPAQTSVESIRNKFAQFGQLQRLVLPPNCPTALIEFIEPTEARTAFRSCAYINFNGNPLYLEWAPEDSFSGPPPSKPPKAQSVENSSLEKDKSMTAIDKENTTLFVKNLNFDTTETSLREFMETSLGEGLIHDISIAKKKDVKNIGNMLSMGYGFIQFKTAQSANEALKNLQHKVLDGHSIELKRSNRAETASSEVKSARKMTNDPGKVSNKLVVRNVPFEATQKEVRDIFATFGELKSVRLPKKVTGSHRGFAFVEFLTEEEAKKAFDKLCHSTHLYGRRLVLEWASQEETLEDLRKRTAAQFVDTQQQSSAKRLKKSKLIESVQSVHPSN